MSIMEAYAHGQFAWVDIMARDVAAAEAFYGNLFGWKVVQLDTHGGLPYAQFEQDGRSVAGFGRMSDEMIAQGVPSKWNSYINVDDVEAAAARAKELGGTIVMPVMKAMEAGWMAIVTDPTGAMVCLWQKNRHIGASLVNEPNSFSWNELATRDAAAARDFYGKLCGWSFDAVEMPNVDYHVIQNAGRSNGGIMQMTPEWGDIPPHWMVYFAVADIDTKVARVTELGGKVNVAPFDTPVGRIAVVADPQGAVFSVIELKNPGA